NGLYALSVAGNSFSVAWHTTSSAGPAIVAGGVVWSIDTGGVLHGYAPDTGASLVSVGLGGVSHFPTPAAGGGRLFAPAGTQVVAFAGV
ncbi:MAG TPA: hypothetical protein VHU24_10120, partial [Solirubrobacterales bacterium]|nr:hypothetical protein [Solirubrobacterales bacterium]